MEILDIDHEAYPAQNQEAYSAVGQKESVVVTAVLTSGVIDNDYAVYVGVGTPEWIAHSGLKLRYKLALRFFPYLKAEEYRA